MVFKRSTDRAQNRISSVKEENQDNSFSRSCNSCGGLYRWDGTIEFSWMLKRYRQASQESARKRIRARLPISELFSWFLSISDRFFFDAIDSSVIHKSHIISEIEEEWSDIWVFHNIWNISFESDKRRKHEHLVVSIFTDRLSGIDEHGYQRKVSIGSIRVWYRIFHHKENNGYFRLLLDIWKREFELLFGSLSIVLISAKILPIELFRFKMFENLSSNMGSKDYWMFRIEFRSIEWSW